jgi:hypothetical protein
MLGHMIDFATWEKYIRLSDGSDVMKDWVIAYVERSLGRPKLLDSFQLGLVLGELSVIIDDNEQGDFLETIRLTRNLDNVPYVQIPRKDTDENQE